MSRSSASGSAPASDASSAAARGRSSRSPRRSVAATRIAMGVTRSAIAATRSASSLITSRYVRNTGGAHLAGDIRPPPANSLVRDHRDDDAGRMVDTVAVLSDIHGVLPALDAVLAEPDVRDADAIVLTGDM